MIIQFQLPSSHFYISLEREQITSNGWIISGIGTDPVCPPPSPPPPHPVGAIFSLSTQRGEASNSFEIFTIGWIYSTYTNLVSKWVSGTDGCWRREAIRVEGTWTPTSGCYLMLLNRSFYEYVLTLDLVCVINYSFIAIRTWRSFVSEIHIIEARVNVILFIRFRMNNAFWLLASLM